MSEESVDQATPTQPPVFHFGQGDKVELTALPGETESIYTLRMLDDSTLRAWRSCQTSWKGSGL